MTNNDIVQKLWNLCDVLRDDGINYSDYVTELVLLLFIKMEFENTEAGILDKHKLPQGCRWPDLRDQSGLNLLNHYKRILLTLSTGKDADDNTVVTDQLILAIYNDAQTRLREPRHLEQLIKSLDGIDWFSAQKDGLGDLYEGLLEKNASETKSGAGQYFTPRPLIDSIIRCIDPQPGEIVQDPAAGTAGFLIAADAYIKKHTDDLHDLPAKQRTFQRNKAFIGGATNMTGSVGHKRVPKKFLESYPLPLPPLAEQKQIAAKLDELLAQVDTIKARLDAIPKILKRFRQSVLAAAVSGRLTEEWRAGRDAQQRAQQAAPLLNSIRATDSGRGKQRPYEIRSVPPVGAPLAAPLVAIGEIATEIRYGTSKKCDYTPGTTPVLRIPNIGDGQVNVEDLKYADFDDAERKKLELRADDLLLIRSNGSVDLVGKTALVGKESEGFLFAGYLIRIRLNVSVANPAFVQLCLRSSQARKTIEIQARSTSGVNNINSQELAALRIPHPPLDEQTEIVRRVEQLFSFADQVEQRVKDAQARVNHLTQSILAKAFRGELTADWRAQNPDLISGENSAEALLARIRAERGESVERGKKSRRPA